MLLVAPGRGEVEVIHLDDERIDVNHGRSVHLDRAAAEGAQGHGRYRTLPAPYASSRGCDPDPPMKSEQQVDFILDLAAYESQGEKRAPIGELDDRREQVREIEERERARVGFQGELRAPLEERADTL